MYKLNFKINQGGKYSITKDNFIIGPCLVHEVYKLHTTLLNIEFVFTAVSGGDMQIQVHYKNNLLVINRCSVAR